MSARKNREREREREREKERERERERFFLFYFSGSIANYTWRGPLIQRCQNNERERVETVT